MKPGITKTVGLTLPAPPGGDLGILTILKHDPGTRRVSIPWELVRNAESQAPPRTTESEGIICILKLEKQQHYGKSLFLKTDYFVIFTELGMGMACIYHGGWLWGWMGAQKWLYTPAIGTQG